VIELQPNIEQVVRIISRLPKDGEEREYRAHVYFENMDEVLPSDKAPAGNLSQMNLKARLAIAVQVILRNGNPKMEVTLKDLKLTQMPDNQQAFRVTVDKEGKRNLYGDFRVYFKPRDGEERLVGAVNGLSSYVPSRLAEYPLQNVKIGELKQGKLRLDLLESASDGGKLLASTNITVP
jgi:fimbrial chaperone protein